jgi:hypothetical protein
MWRVLRPNGSISLLEPDRRSFAGLYALLDYYFRLFDPGHVRYYTASELLALLANTGFVGGRLLERHESLLSGGKVFATAVVIKAQRGDSLARTPLSALSAPEASRPGRLPIGES